MRRHRITRSRATAWLVTLLLTPAALRAATIAQSSAPAAGVRAFEVASVKPNDSGELRVSIQAVPGGRFTATNAPLRALIRHGYQLQDFQLVGGPKWLDADRFDIV